MKYLPKQLLIYFILLCVSCSHTKLSQTDTIYDISQIDSKLKADSLKVVESFVRALDKRIFYTLLDTMNQTEMTFEGIRYMPSIKFADTCIRLAKQMNVSIKNIMAYSFDDIEDIENSDIKPLALKMYRVFDDKSVLVVAELEFRNNETHYTRQFLFVVTRNKSNAPQIIALSGFLNQPEYTESFDTEYILIRPFRIHINIPKDFNLRETDDRHITYYFRDEFGNEAAFQIFAVRSNDIKGEAMKYIRQIVKKQGFSDFSVRYIPHGYKFQFFIVDAVSKVKIIKVSAIKHRNKIVFITFTADEQLYYDRQVEINYCLSNVGLF